MKYKHDCEKCVYLGVFECLHVDQAIWDLYFCEQGGYHTVIARYGDEGYEYVSGKGFAIHGTAKPLREALKRAVSRGLTDWSWN